MAVESPAPTLGALDTAVCRLLYDVCSRNYCKHNSTGMSTMQGPSFPLRPQLYRALHSRWSCCTRRHEEERRPREKNVTKNGFSYPVQYYTQCKAHKGMAPAPSSPPLFPSSHHLARPSMFLSRTFKLACATRDLSQAWLSTCRAAQLILRTQKRATSARRHQVPAFSTRRVRLLASDNQSVDKHSDMTLLACRRNAHAAT